MRSRRDENDPLSDLGSTPLPAASQDGLAQAIDQRGGAFFQFVAVTTSSKRSSRRSNA